MEIGGERFRNSISIIN